MVSAQKKLVEYHIGRLRDKNPEVRLKAIGELALLADTDALEALESVFKNDPNSDVRKAAQEAGRAVFLKLKEQEQRDNQT
jgi:HEAT repeat protein